MRITLLTIIALTLSFICLGQSPEGFKYQAVVRDASSNPMTDQAVGIQITIQQGSIGGAVVYQETFAPTTNGYGLVNLEIGTGISTDDFTMIDWANGPYFMETAVDLTGGTTYEVMGTSQLMSVPYALYAKTSGNGEGPQGDQGIQGETGIQGEQGETGDQGPVGLTGVQGIQGEQGEDGDQGPIGSTGAQGEQGIQGETGVQGIQGVTGDQGPIGLTGIQGIQGETGAQGTQGATGVQGIQGEQGEDGVGIAQNLSVSGDTLSISDGNSIVLPSEESCLDASNIELSSSIVDVYANSSQVNQAIGTCVQYTAAEDISNGSVCVTVISNNKVMAANPSVLGSQMEYEKLIGIALEDAVAGETVRILEEGYCTVRADELLLGSPTQIEIQLSSSNSGNTLSLAETIFTFMDSGGDGGDYSNNQEYEITFDAGSGNTAEIVIDSESAWNFEHFSSGSMYDRLGFQTSNDGISWANASIMGMCSSDEVNPPWSQYQVNEMNGYIFPETFVGLEPLTSSNPTANNNGSQMALQSLPAIIAPGARYLKFYFRSDGSVSRDGWKFKIKSSNPVFQVNDLLYLSGTNLENASNTATGSAALGYGLLGVFNGTGSYVFARIHDR